MGTSIQELERLHQAHCLIEQKIDSYIADALQSGSTLGLMSIEFPGLDTFTVRYGYEVRHALMSEFGARLAQGMRPQDKLLPQMHGRFLLLTPGLQHQTQVILAANKVIRLCEDSFLSEGLRLSLRPHIGIVLLRAPLQSGRDLIQRAEMALEDAKRSGNPYQLYDSAKDEELALAQDMETELDLAMENGEFVVFFQPKVSMLDERPTGAEALIRWMRPDGTQISPEIFMTLADQTGQIHDLTKFVINAAIRQAADWPTDEHPLSLAVNMTPRVLVDSGVTTMIRDALQIWNLPPERLTLEVTESGLMEEPQRILERLRVIRELGAGVSIDDFGTGYSSFEYFKRIPATELKIDKSFVFNLLSDPADAKIVSTVVKLARQFDLKVVAEGVEDKATLSALQELGCDYAQGYYFSKPLPQQEFLAWLKTTPAAASQPAVASDR